MRTEANPSPTHSRLVSWPHKELTYAALFTVFLSLVNPLSAICSHWCGKTPACTSNCMFWLKHLLFLPSHWIRPKWAVAQGSIIKGETRGPLHPNWQIQISYIFTNLGNFFGSRNVTVESISAVAQSAPTGDQKSFTLKRSETVPKEIIYLNVQVYTSKA